MKDAATWRREALRSHRRAGAFLAAWAALAAVAAVACASAAAAATDQPALGRWEPMPALKDVGALVVDPGGTVWVQHDRKVLVLDGQEFRPPPGPPLVSGMYLSAFFGGPDRGAYLTQPGTKDHQGSLLRLEGGRAAPVTEFTYDVAHEAPCVYVSKTGRVFNWGKAFLAEYVDDKWSRIDAQLGQWPSILDGGDTVWFTWNRRLYRADRGGRLAECELPAALAGDSEKLFVQAALLGRDKAIFISPLAKGLRAVDLGTGRRILADRLDAAFAGRDIYRATSAADGAVWVVATDKLSENPPVSRNLFFRVAPDGAVQPVRETAVLQGGYQPYPYKSLSAADGSFWMGGAGGSLVRWKDGRARIFDWRDGLELPSVDILAAAPDGRIIAAPYAVMAGGAAAYVFRPDVPAPPPAADLALWTDYRTDRHGIVRDGKGGLWMFLADRPGQASRWDGNAWGHVKVPFDTKKASRCLGDDRGHLLVEVEGDDAGAYDVAPDGVRRQAAFPAVLAAAVKAGVRQFEPSPDYAGCAVTDGGEIWFGAANDKVVHHYDGRAWSEAAVGIAPGGIVLSPRHGVLIADHAYKLGFYILRDGHLESIAELNRKAARGMLGPWGLQPFEESLLDRRPDAYVPIDFAGRWELYPLVRIREDGRTYSTRGDPWTSYWSRIIPAAGGVGFWSSKDPGGSMPLRLVSGVEFPCDFVRTPLDGETVCQAMDDPAHNVWFTTVESAEVRHVWVKRLDGFRIKVAEMPAESERQLKVQAEAVLPGLRADRLGLLWRVDDGPWRRGFPGGEATVLFAASGPHDVQIMGVDPTGGTTPERATRRVTATVALPKILAMMPGPVTVEDVVWTPPVWARPSAPSEIAVVAYRTGDEEWQDSPDGRISMTRFQPGTFDMDLTARESRFFRDPVPVRMTVTYAPDARLIVEKRMEALAGADAHVSWVTREELLKVGPLIVPIVREKLGAGVENRQVREAFEAILAKYDKAAPSEKSGGK